MVQERRRSHGGSRLPLRKRLTWGLLVFSMLVVAAEVASRVAFTVLEDRRQLSERWWAYSPTMGWTRSPGFTGRVYGTYTEFDDAGYYRVDSDEVGRRTGKLRVVAVGDSCTYGLLVPVAQSFGEVLEELAPEVEVINLGVPGYSSYQGLALLEQRIEALQPDVITVAFNWNDRRAVARPESADGERSYYTAWIWQSMRRSYAARSLSRIFRSSSARDHDVTELTARVEPDRYRAHLERFVELARSHDADVLMLGMADNPSMVAALRQGVELIGQEQLEAAIEQLTPLTRMTDHLFVARRYAIDALERRGAQEEALKLRRVEVSESAHGSHPVYLDSDYLAIMRDVAAEQGVRFVDVGGALSAHPEEYIDHCHFTAAGHRRVADQLARVLRERKTEATGSERAVPGASSTRSVMPWTDPHWGRGTGREAVPASQR